MPIVMPENYRKLVTISKSKYVAGAQCLKRLYLLVHEPGLAGGPDAADFALMDQGRQVGKLARQLFPGGVEVKSGDPEVAIRSTRELVANTEVPAIFEGAFEHGGVLVRTDILQRRRDGRWRLIEVKSTADLKDHHLDDVAIQYRVVSRCGLDLASACLAHVNRSYVFPGGTIDPRQFFRIRNLTRRVERLQPKLTFLLRSEFRVLAMPKAPDIPPGPQCTDPITCEFYDRCNPPHSDDHVGRLPRINGRVLEEFEEMGIESIRDIPEDFDLSEIQRRACTAVQTGQPYYSTELAKELRTLKYPLFFMDFETVNPAIPRFPGMRPFDQIPFQWSVHVQREPGAEPEHYEFLATDKSDPRREFIEFALRCAGRTGQHRRVQRHVRVAEALRACRMAAGVRGADRANTATPLGLAARHAEPCVPPGIRGIVLAEGRSACARSRDDIRRHGGGERAGRGLAWESLVRGLWMDQSATGSEKALREYCGQDTLALVSLVEKLRKLYHFYTRCSGTSALRFSFPLAECLGRSWKTMALAKQFDSDLNELFLRRTAWLRSAVGEEAPRPGTCFHEKESWKHAKTDGVNR